MKWRAIDALSPSALDEARAAIGYAPTESRRPSVPPALDHAEATFARLDRTRRATIAALTAGSTQSPEASASECIDMLSGDQA